MLMLLTGDDENYFFSPSLSLSGMSSASGGQCQPVSVHPCTAWLIVGAEVFLKRTQAELEQSASLINIGRAENTGECGETVATPCTRSGGVVGGGGNREVLV